MNNIKKTAFTIPLSATLLLTFSTFCCSANIIDASNDAPVEKEQLIEMIKLQNKQLHEQQQSIVEQEKQFLQYQRAMKEKLAAQQKSIDQLKALVNQPSLKEDTAGKKPVVQQTKETAATPGSASPTRTPDHSIKPVGTPPKTSDARHPLEVAAVFDQPGVLTPKGNFNIEPSLLYSNYSNDRISLVGFTIIPAITIGLIDVRRISGDTFVARLAARYGVTNRIELEGMVPYVYRSESISRSPFATPGDITDSSADGDGLGDIEFGVRYQLNKPTTGGTAFIAGLRVKTDTGTGPFDVAFNPYTNLRSELPTGSGFWGIQPSFTVIFPTDPAVFFGTINYLWNVEREVGTVNNIDYGEFDPGDAFGLSFGMGLALNEKASFSVGYDHWIITESSIDGVVPAGEMVTTVGSLMVGTSYLVRDNLSVVVSLGVGVTEAAPDVQLTIKAPFSILF